MELTLTRTTKTETYTEGELLVDHVQQCYTLELPVRDGLPGSAIPDGTYPVYLSPSPKFEHAASLNPWWDDYWQTIPHIIQIPNRTNILIHTGNTTADTDGCVLVGNIIDSGYLGDSKSAFAALHARLVQANDAGEPITITVITGA